jgi:hypothetical protein
MKKNLFTILFVLTVAVAFTDFVHSANSARCSKTELLKVLNALSAVRTWQDLYGVFKVLNGCDSGGVSETISDSLARLLSEQFDTFPKLLEISRTDPAFKAFVFRHLDSTIPADIWGTILQNVSQKCPLEAVSICEAIQCQLRVQMEINK